MTGHPFDDLGITRLQVDDNALHITHRSGIVEAVALGPRVAAYITALGQAGQHAIAARDARINELHAGITRALDAYDGTADGCAEAQRILESLGGEA